MSLRWAGWSLLLAMGLLAAAARADSAPDIALKADYLPKFVPFITWPDAVFTSASQPVTICVLGEDSFGGKLEESAGATRAGERAIAVRHLAAPDPEAPCQLLFIGGDGEAAENILEALKGKPVVTVTDTDVKAHGVISFVIDAGHVRFDIDDAAAAQDGLVISSKLLGLAHAVKERGHE